MRIIASMNQSNPVFKAKQALRADLKQRRSALGEDLRRGYSRQITSSLISMPEYQSARSVFCFISYATEVHTHDLLRYMLTDGKSITVPHIIKGQPMQAIPLQDWDQLTPDSMGILSPAGGEPYSGHTDLVITPGLGFTAQGFRIGYGAGYYDRWFEQHSTGTRIAVAFETQLVDELPLEATDLPVDIIVTENRIISIGN